MIINIEPVDTLFFRDSKPFGRGSEHFAKSMFPPSPQTLYGALRTKTLETLNCDYENFRQGTLVLQNQNHVEKIDIDKISKEIGSINAPGTFILKGPLLIEAGKTIYVKLPADIKIYGDNSSKQCKTLKPFDWSKFGVETDFNFLNVYPHTAVDEPIEDINGYITLSTLAEYFLGREIKHQEIKNSSEIFDYEMQTGIGVNSATNTTKPGLLYIMGFLRLKKEFALCAEIKNLSALPENGFIKLGGANRVCKYSKLPENPLKSCLEKTDEIKKLISENRKFKILFLTSAFFNKGWFSDKFDDKLEMQIGRIKIRLLSAVIGKSENISGWDIARNKPKSMKKLVPAGTVYYFELFEGSVDNLFEQLNFVNFSDENQNLGFGLTLIGGINNV